MPIEIRELVIKAIVSETRKDNTDCVKQEDLAKMKKELVKEITDKVIKTLNQKNER
jgi:phenylpyruvate tautomerase PptA (4-oxalocrotonate tautomerase family)